VPRQSSENKRGSRDKEGKKGLYTIHDEVLLRSFGREEKEKKRKKEERALLENRPPQFSALKILMKEGRKGEGIRWWGAV